MKNLIYILVFVLTYSYGLEVSKNTKCEGYRDHLLLPATAAKECVVDDLLQEYISCLDYYGNGFGNHQGTGKKGKGGYSSGDNYIFFMKEIDRILLKEVKNVIDESQSFMCVKNTEDDLFRYQESIAGHEWCYAPKFRATFSDKISESMMSIEYFAELYDTRNDMLVSKNKPKNKEVLCGVYFECMSSFIHANHTRVSSELSALYEKTRNECFPAYTIELTRIKDIVKNGINRGLKATSPEIISLKEMSKRVIFIDPKKGEIKNVPLNSENYSVRTGYKQAYDYTNCKVYLEALDKKEDSELNRAVVRVASSSPNKQFDNNTYLIFEIMDVEPLIDINWYDFMGSDLTINKKGTYVKTDIASKTIYGDPEKYAAMQMVVKRAGEAHLDSKCNIDDAEEFARGYWFDMPGYKLSYEYDMDIRPATKSEIHQARGFLKNMKNNLKDRQLFKTLNNGKIISKWKNRPENQEKLKKEMDGKMGWDTD